jgi:hypothetical protein
MCALAALTYCILPPLCMLRLPPPCMLPLPTCMLPPPPRVFPCMEEDPCTFPPPPPPPPPYSSIHCWPSPWPWYWLDDIDDEPLASPTSQPAFGPRHRRHSAARRGRCCRGGCRLDCQQQRSGCLSDRLRGWRSSRGAISVVGRRRAG